MMMYVSNVVDGIIEKDWKSGSSRVFISKKKKEMMLLQVKMYMYNFIPQDTKKEMMLL